MATEKIENGIANPSPLGLLGFGMTTLLLNLHNGSIIPLSAVILAMGLCLGGTAQIIAGIMESEKTIHSEPQHSRLTVSSGYPWWRYG